VTADTVLKWIKKGKIPATRTAGGHYRVLWSDVQRLRDGTLRPSPEPEDGESVYCWEFHAAGNGVAETCISCIVYRAHALHCFELSGVPLPEGRAGTFCSTSCLDCAYYMAHFEEQISAVVVVCNPERRAVLEEALPPSSSLQLTFTCSVYETAIAIRDTNPDYVVLHGSMPQAEREELRRHIEGDRRFPDIVVLVVGDGEEGGAESASVTGEAALVDIQTEIWQVHRARNRRTDQPPRSAH
jgi:excisionase family DNA binding protein